MITKLYVFESFKSTDPLRSGKVLADRMALLTSVHFKSIADVPTLFNELQWVKADLIALAAPAVIHIDCHGNENGVALFDAVDRPTFLPWQNLRAIFRDIYVSAPVKPLISFSTCKGLNAMQLIAEYEPCPYEAIAGCLEEIEFQASIDAFYLFYTELLAGSPLVDATAGVSEKYPELKFFAAPALVLSELAWRQYKRDLTPLNIEGRKREILAEVALQQGGAITQEQIAKLDALLTPDSGDRDQQRHMDIFNT